MHFLKFIPGELGTRYARALVDVITRPGAATTPEKVTAELSDFVAVLEGSRELRNVLTSPAVAPRDKAAVISGLASRLGMSRTTQNFLKVVVDRRRLDLLDQMLTAFETLLDERLGMARAEVASAQPLESGQQHLLAARLTEVTGRKVRLRLSVDPKLLGGVAVQIGSTMYDGSVRGKLEAIERRLATE